MLAPEVVGVLIGVELGEFERLPHVVLCEVEYNFFARGRVDQPLAGDGRGEPAREAGRLDVTVRAVDVAAAVGDRVTDCSDGVNAG